MGISDTIPNVYEPFPLPPDTFNDKIADISAGFDTAYVLTETGQLYGCGSNLYKQLGKSDDYYYEFKIIDNSRKYKEVFAFFDYVFASELNSEWYFAWGNNLYNQVSTSMQTLIQRPQRNDFNLASPTFVGGVDRVILVVNLRIDSWGNNAV